MCYSSCVQHPLAFLISAISAPVYGPGRVCNAATITISSFTQTASGTRGLFQRAPSKYARRSALDRCWLGYRPVEGQRTGSPARSNRAIGSDSPKTDDSVGAGPHAYGATTIMGGDGSRQPTDNELQGARYQGRKIVEVAKKLHG